MQAMGAEGFRADYVLGRHMASAKMAQYLDGTTEIQNVVISRALFKTGGQSLRHEDIK
jgi:alkylation response protein AidB-like acyl-CoA dehydrogenase